MPKLDGTHLPGRLAEKLADLKSGKEVAARDIKALLNDAQIAAMDAAWAEQQELRKGKRARTKEEEKELGWKTKREIHIEAYERAVAEANEDELGAYEKRIKQAEARSARIYLDAYFAARDEGKEPYQADLAARNDLKRAHLEKVDASRKEKRDEEVWAMEEELRKLIEKNMTPEEREQLELLREHEKAVLENRKKRGG